MTNDNSGPKPHVRLSLDIPPDLEKWLRQRAGGPRKRNAFIVQLLEQARSEAEPLAERMRRARI